MPVSRSEAVRGSFDGWNRGDFDAWLESAHPEVEWISDVIRRMEGAERVYRGREEMRRFWDEWRSVWDVTIEVSELRESGDRVLALGSLRTSGGASGIHLDRPAAWVFEFEGHLVRRARAYMDPQQGIDDFGA